jgi:putative flippase GtrA
MKIRGILTGKSEKTPVHLMRSAVSSTIGFAVDFGILVFLVEAAGIHYIVSATIGFAVGTTITYLFSILWIFPRRNFSRKSAEYMVFIGVGVVGIILNDILLWFYTDILSIYYMVSRVLGGVMVFFWNFLARKRLLFR